MIDFPNEPSGHIPNTFIAFMTVAWRTLAETAGCFNTSEYQIRLWFQELKARTNRTHSLITCGGLFTMVPGYY